VKSTFVWKSRAYNVDEIDTWSPDLLALLVSSVVLIRSQNVVATPKWALLNLRRKRARSFRLKSDPQEWARWSTCLRSLLLRSGATSQLFTLVVSSRSNARLLILSRCKVGLTISKTTLLVRKSERSSEGSATVVETLSETSPSSPSSSSSLPDLLHSSCNIQYCYSWLMKSVHFYHSTNY